MVRSSTALATSASDALPVWSKVVQKGQPTDSLVKKLKVLRQELANADQDEIPQKALDHVRKQIMHDDLLFHKHKEVRIFLACSLADLLRLYAPDCPFSDDELSTIFAFFLAVLGSTSAGLQKVSGPHFTDCVTLLSNLVSMRAFALLCERATGDSSTEAYFAKFLTIVTPSFPKNVEMLMADALASLLHYSNSISSKIVATLLNQLHVKVQRTNPAAYQFAALVCKTAADELQASVAQYFATSLTKAAQQVDDEERTSTLHTLHLHVSHIQSVAPAILVNVIPRLEEELRAEDSKLRQMATRTLGGMFSSRSRQSNQDVSGQSLYKSAFEAWSKRAWDKVAHVRVTWIESAVGMLSNSSSSSIKVASLLQQKITDSDERVRLAAIKVIADLSLSNLLTERCMNLLHSVGERILDKRHAVRLAALGAVGRAFSLAHSTLSSDDQAAFLTFTWIPGTICGALFAGDDKGLASAAMVTFDKYILPLPSVVEGEDCIAAWSERLLLILDCLNDEQLSAFVKMIGMQGRRVDISRFVQACRRFNGGTVEGAHEDEIRRSLLSEITALASNFTDQVKAAHDLHAFAQKNDERSYKLLINITDRTARLQDIVKYYRDLDRKFAPEKYNATLLALTTMTSFTFVNTSAVPSLFGATSSQGGARSGKAMFVLSLMVAHLPEMLKPHIGLFKGALADRDADQVQLVMTLRTLAALKSQGHLQGADELDESELERLETIIKEASDDRMSKYSAKLLSLIASDIAATSYATAFHIAENLCERLAKNMAGQRDERQMNASLVALQQIVKHAREIIGDHSDVITKTLLERVLLQPLSEPVSPLADDNEPDDAESKDWIEDSRMSFSMKIRISALRYLVARTLAYADHEDAEKFAVPTLRALMTCLTTGELGQGLCDDHDGAKARLRCEAACLILKLARKGSCDRLIGVTDLHLFSQLFQDPVWQVRHAILRKWLKHFLRRSSHLPPRYYVLGFMVAFDPENESRNLVRNACAQLLRVMKPEMRLRYFDVGLARLLHMLNHHPDFESAVPREGDVSIETLEEVAPYIDFYLSSCAGRDNLACLHHIALRCKGMRDVADERTSGTFEDDGKASKGLHTLSDLCICLIKRRAESLGCLVDNWQGHVALPRDLFVPYVSREEQNKILKRSYLNDEAIELFSQPQRNIKTVNGIVPPKRDLTHLLEHDMPTAGATKRIKGASTKTKPRKSSNKKRPRAHDRSSDEEEDEATSEDEEGEDVVRDQDEDAPVSEDETVEPSSEEEEETAGRGARVRRRVRQEKRSRNADRQKRRGQRVS